MSVFRVFLSLFSHIMTENGYLENKYPCSVQIQDNQDQKISKYGHFLRNIDSCGQYGLCWIIFDHYSDFRKK